MGRKITYNESEIQDVIFRGNAVTHLKRYPPSVIDLIVTSPPYADNRKGTYKGFPINKYVGLFLPIAAELKRVLKPEGSFILNIKERAIDGERQTYVLELILALKEQGWLWTEEYVWCKSNCYPGKWPNRFRDSWERCLHFTLQKKFKMRQDQVMIPIGKWARGRLKNLSETDKVRDNSKVGSGFGKNVSNWLNRSLVYPTNVLHLSTECANRKHSATFPIGLPSWFIKLFTDEKDLVLDPFMGVATTALACLSLNRHYTGVELSPEYHKLSESYIKTAQEKMENKRDRRGNGHRRVREKDIRELKRIPQTPVTGSPKSTSAKFAKTQKPVPV
jgi:site-specific DNA-methyltransferase (adenine-specific)